MAHVFTARVRNGRLVLDEIADASLSLEEGDTIELVSIDDLLLNRGALSEEDERAALDRVLEASLAEEQAGKLFDFAEVLAELRRGSER
jgi:hypothetical protein